ncbi:MAG: hypothetical protein JRI95_05015 [Deltaproteobacteria bacterium]|nr:hypothetical protein [Deltaproteobacteria bacterium]MBW2085006.1 hypothetical protein [Deltaproteobacteria bacterium]
MKFDYLTNDTEKSLAPFFSPLMLSVSFNSIWILGLILLIFWPTKDLFTYFQGHKIPLNFLGVFVAALLINSYLGLRCGRGEMFAKDYFSRLGYEGVITLEEEHNFFSYGLAAFILHSIFLLLIVLPLLIVSAAVSGISMSVFFKVLTVLFTASLLCRLFAFLMYLVFGKWSFLGYLLSRGFLIFFLFVTAVFASFINPVFLIYAFYQGQELLPRSSINAYGYYMMIVTCVILLLTLANQVMIRHNKAKRK